MRSVLKLNKQGVTPHQEDKTEMQDIKLHYKLQSSESRSFYETSSLDNAF